MNYVKIEEGIVTQSIIADAEYFKTFIDTSPGDWVTVDSADAVSYTHLTLPTKA